VQNPFSGLKRGTFDVGIGNNNGKALSVVVEFAYPLPGTLGLPDQQRRISEQVSEISAERFEALFDSCKAKLYESWTLYGQGSSFDKWLRKRWDESRNRFRI